MPTLGRARISVEQLLARMCARSDVRGRGSDLQSVDRDNAQTAKCMAPLRDVRPAASTLKNCA